MSNNKLKIGDVEFSSRIIIKDIRRAKTEHGLDLSATDSNSQTIRIHFDPLVLTEVIFALYEERLAQKKIETLEQLEDRIAPEDMEPLREGLIEAVSGFFPLVKIVATKMREAQDGRLDHVIQNALREQAGTITNNNQSGSS